jgi:hypothetical protein
MMDTIYKCASLTIVALSGQDSNSGLPGINQNYRSSHIMESIDGLEYGTTGPRLAGSLEKSNYNTRAWTLQEFAFAKRKLVFESQQTYFSCENALFSESIEDSYDPAGFLERQKLDNFPLQKVATTPFLHTPS